MSSNADLTAAIIAARSNPANAAFFAHTPSNYLGSSAIGLNTGQLQAIAATGTVNVLSGGVAYHVTPGTGSTAFNYTPVGYDPNYYISKANTPTPTNTLVPSNTANPTTGRTVGDVVSGGFSQIKSFFSGPTGGIALAAIAGLGLLLVLKK